MGLKAMDNGGKMIITKDILLNKWVLWKKYDNLQIEIKRGTKKELKDYCNKKKIKISEESTK
jgi:hypothetical protein